MLKLSHDSRTKCHRKGHDGFGSQLLGEQATGRHKLWESRGESDERNRAVVRRRETVEENQQIAVQCTLHLADQFGF